ncbi:hypothetical protein ACRAKI_19620 [Saccharothrix isguenensis]
MTDLKPWQHQQPNEERAQFLSRLAHSCYRCGRRENDLGALAEHEDRCTGGDTPSGPAEITNGVVTPADCAP